MNSRCLKIHRSYSMSFNWSITLVNFSIVEFQRTVSKLKKKKNRKSLSCVSRSPQNEKLGSFTLWLCNDGKGKERYKTAWCTCKVFFFIQPVCLFVVLVAVRRRRCLSPLSLVTVRARSGLFLFSRIFSDHNAAAESFLFTASRVSFRAAGRLEYFDHVRTFEHCFSIRVSFSFPEVVKVIIPCCKILRNKWYSAKIQVKRFHLVTS